ncbi:MULTISPECIES: vanchrobactin non-ribosomal peptide synthetase VabF [unclassified Vibrio]|uniref:vanchrobactin non-ribosomal peptide synthetase VabF n=1 Tax=unclassified Vibrio TaxID=2614977 RepID=UPI000B8E519F|nr:MULTISPECIES: vanchrobactin non-ribosomal peptide synthetase VabF [unclassified Vibrio]NAX44993.1 vanchrobactin non-ribosomal peptide synthetase VabF [Vibrio sp. V25_P4S6T154]OXX50511.1 non-ribosomal peptide synthetase [Vibrio sp. V17_P4S1T151]OXX59021.1 non-ribosomal peptide synthetase [Vibrio sp. V15_P4S5T153]OXX70804.1 non-ribosomal peptide synthetase [Vibrio sp. V20_P4S3T152]
MYNSSVQEDQWPLIGTQQGIWFAEQMMPNPEQFNVAHYVVIQGQIDIELFLNAVAIGLQGVDSLHCHYLESDGSVRQQFYPADEEGQWLEILDFSQAALPEESAREWMKHDLAQRLDISVRKRRFRHCLIDVGSSNAPQWFWYQRYHHIDVDGFSVNAISQYICQLYNHWRIGAAKPQEFSAFSDVIQEYQQFLDSAERQQAYDFWQTQAAHLPNVISLTTGSAANTSSSTLTHTVPLIGGEWLTRYSPQLLPAELAMAMVFAYLHLHSGQEQVCVGVPFMRRMGNAATCAAGAVVNVLPVALSLHPQMSIIDVAREMNKTIRQVRRHQMYDAEQIQRDLRLVGQPLYGPILNFKPFEAALNLSGVETETHILSAGPIDEIEFSPVLDGQTLSVNITANSTKYSQESLELHAARFVAMVEQIANHPTQPLDLVELIPPSEKQQITLWSVGPQHEHETEQTVLDVWHQTVESKPNEEALVFKQQRWTFDAFNHLIETRADQLITAGLRQGDIAGVALRRGPESVVTMLAILRAGAIYLPIDLDYPIERIESIVEQARPWCLVVEENEQNMAYSSISYVPRFIALPELARIHTAPQPKPTISHGDVAYIIFTSGSTGHPKGVMNTHGALLNLLRSHQGSIFSAAISKLATRRQLPEQAITVRAAHTTSFSFDASWEQVLWMLSGHTMYLYDDEQRKDAYELVQCVAEDNIDALDLPPLLFDQMLDSGLMTSAHVPTLVLIGSEAIPQKLWSRVSEFPELLVENFYGPTEFTVDAISASLDADASPVIGRPIAGACVYVLDENLEPVAIGEVGELYLSGAGLAKGYLNQPSMTAERFVANPFAYGKIMYRTGDLVKWRDNGLLDFVGRCDHQIKIRGFRIELGDVESAINAIDGVNTTVVVAESVGDTHRLLAYCTLEKGAQGESVQPAFTEQRLQSLIAQALPDYMQPANVMILDAFSLNVNGKIDRKALPKYSAGTRSERVAPITQPEQLLCDAITELLGVSDVGMSDDFFNLGGDSISAMSLGTRLRTAGYDLRPKAIFAARQLGMMAGQMVPLQQQQREKQEGIIRPLPMWQWFEETFSNTTSYVQSVLVEVESETQLAHLQASLVQLVANHSVCRLVQKEQQYHIEALQNLDVKNWVESVSVERLDGPVLDSLFSQRSQSMSISSGQLLRLVMITERSGRKSLMILAHHFLIDGVSWRILLPQLQALTQAQVTGEVAVISEEVTGIHCWSKALYQHLAVAAAQMPFWRAQAQRAVAPIKDPVDKIRMTHWRTPLSHAVTQPLLELPTHQTNLDIEEMLLAAVTGAIAGRYGCEEIKVNVESHGREECKEEIDLNQTLGWFTTEYPLIINVPKQGDYRERLREVKQSKRSVKDKGLGYMVLRYLDNPYRDELRTLANTRQPSLLFNYLGRFQSSDGQWSPQQYSGQFADTFAVTLNSERALQHPLELNIFVEESATPRLVLNWSWNAHLFSQQEMVSLSQQIESELLKIQQALQVGDSAELDLSVPADYTEPGITLRQASLLQHHYGKLADVLPALPLQEGLLFQSQLGDKNSSYNSTTRLTFQGQLSEHRVSEALNAVIRRHPQLLARFDSSILGRTVQVMTQVNPSWPLTRYDITNMSGDEQSALIDQLEKQELSRQFDLNDPTHSLLQAQLIFHGDQQSTLLLSAHHLVVDGWSTPILLNDFLSAYAQGVSNLPPVTVGYAHVVSQLTQRDKTVATELWCKVLADVQPSMAFDDIPLSEEVNEHQLWLSKHKTDQLNQCLRHHGLTMSTLMQGLWASILASMTGREEVVFGTPISGRFSRIASIDEQIGLFSNTVPVRVTLQPHLSLSEQLKAHQAIQIQLLEHDELGLGEIQQLVGGKTLFDTLLVVENYPDHSRWYQQDFSGAKLMAIHNRGYTHYPLTILVLPGEQLHILFEYRDRVGVAKQIVQRFEQMLDEFMVSSDKPFAEWDLRLSGEIELQQRVNQTKTAVERTTLRDLMITQQQRSPHQLALIDSEHRFTYQALAEQVAAIADLLLQQGVKAGDIVAVALPRSATLSLAIYSIIECGAAYLPLDVGYPDERLAYMINDAKPALIITCSSFTSRFEGLATLLLLDKLPAPVRAERQNRADGLTPSNAAYLLYTSGSTGNPKGVLVSHQAIVNRLKWMQHQYPLSSDDVVLQKTPCSFDVSVWEFFWPLLEGASLVMAPAEAHKDPEWLLQIIDDYHVTTMHFVPSMLAAFMASIEATHPTGFTVAPSLKQVFCSGEALAKELCHQYARRINAPLHNLYGPTEAAVDVTYYPAYGEALNASVGRSAPIGLPVWNTQVYVLDSFLRAVPIGVPGELYLAGEQLAIGYFNRSALTADRFIANPFTCGERMYRTGDVVRWLACGSIEYLGRSDDQIKIRGQRVELGEIESALQALPAVKQALVCAQTLSTHSSMLGADERQIIGYVIAHDMSVTNGEKLRAELSEHLPAHMVPAAIVLLDHYPLSANGKLDKKALPRPNDVAVRVGRKAHPGLETQLVTLFSQVLAVETLFADDDFFTLGGHSLLAMKLAADIRRALNLPVTVGQIMVNPTVEKLASLLLDEDAFNDPTLAGFGEVLPIRAGSGPALFCVNSASGFAWQYTGLPKYLTGHYPIYGLQSPRPGGAMATSETMEEVCDRLLPVLREVQPFGPYHLLGYSFGGIVAQKLAAKLQQQGEEVHFLGLLDTYPPEGQSWDGPMDEEEQYEIEREKEQFLAINELTDIELDEQRLAMFNEITANYEDAVRLLAQAQTSDYQGPAHLFVAQRTVPDGYDIDAHWQSFVGQLIKHQFDCSHEDILAPENVRQIGECLNTLLESKAALKK